MFYARNTKTLKLALKRLKDTSFTNKRFLDKTL
jgi:hypothetical protein